MEQIISQDKNESIKYKSNLDKISGNIIDIAKFLKIKNNKNLLNLDIDKRNKENTIYQSKEILNTEENEYKKIKEIFMSLIHDIKNPLTVISGYANSLRSEDFTDEKRNEFLNRIESESDRLINIIRNFLNVLSKDRDLDQMEISEVNIENILKYFYNLYEVKAKEKNIDFKLEIPEKLPLISGNYEKLEFVVLNLLSNAFKFVTAKGIVYIEAKTEGNYVKIQITNSVSKAIINDEIIHEKLNTTNTSNYSESGTGLGLYIVKKIIQKHNGEVGVDINEVEEITTFYFKLPIKDIKNDSSK
jgi:signal transduction histidine kinase